MRPHRGRGASGKTRRVYGLVDAHWDEIEGDLAVHMHGVDAMDFFRGRRPWNQFLRLVDRLSLIEGTACWALKFSDPATLDSLWEKYRKNRRLFDNLEDVRPPLLGFDRQQSMLTNVVNMLIGLRKDIRPEIGRSLQPIPAPVFLKEAVEARWKELSRVKREKGISEAQDRWTRIYEQTGVKPNG